MKSTTYTHGTDLSMQLTIQTEQPTICFQQVSVAMFSQDTEIGISNGKAIWHLEFLDWQSNSGPHSASPAASWLFLRALPRAPEPFARSVCSACTFAR